MHNDSLRDEAWIGDAVLALFARQWILDNPPPAQLSRTEAFKKITTNEFLSSFGEPTAVEAHIGRIYQTDGLDAAFAWIAENILPRARAAITRTTIRTPGKRHRPRR